MDIGRITDDEVKQVLGHMLSTRSLQDSALVELDLISERLESDRASPSGEARTWALAELLVDVVQAQLQRLRAATLSEAERPDEDDSSAGLTSAFSVGSADLEAWSCIQYRYLALVPVQVQDIAAIIQSGSAHGRRLVSRRLSRGYTLLAHVLCDLERQAHTRQQAAAEPAAAGADRRGREPVESRLPSPTSSFIGRDRELAELRQVLDHTRLVTLTGLGGAGKTRLSVRLAETVVDEFPDGAFFVDLSLLADPEHVPQAVADALGVQIDGGRTAEDALSSFVARRRTLIVLDNCEHLIYASAEVSHLLLSAGPGVKLLATSREALLTAGETVWPVPPLGRGPGTERQPVEPADQECNDAVRLFVERAESVKPGFRLDETNTETVTQLCERLEGIPLAIELAAARVRHLAPTEILARIDDRFKLMATTVRGVPERHKTLRATLDSSHELLTDGERAVLRRLAVFRGGWSLEAAEAVCSGEGIEEEDVLELLSRLVDKSLVRVALNDKDGTRYSLLDMVRAFAGEMLDASGEADAIYTRHADWFRSLLEAADPHLRGISPSRMALKAQARTRQLEAGGKTSARRWGRRGCDGVHLIALAHMAAGKHPGGAATPRRGVEASRSRSADAGEVEGIALRKLSGGTSWGC